MSVTVLLDDRLQSYEPFFDFQWSNAVENLSKATGFDDAVLKLCIAWRGAVNVHAFPYVMVTSMDAFSAGLLKSHVPFAHTAIEALKKRLVSEMSGSLCPNAQAHLQAKIDEICKGALNAYSSTDNHFDRQKYFSGLMKNSELQMSVRESQRLVYVSLFFAYENFVLTVYGLIAKEQNPRIRTAAEFGKKLARILPQEVTRACWSDPNVTAARLVRNALAHNGGKVTEELEKTSHGLQVAGGELHVKPADNRDLFDCLKVRVTMLLEEALCRLS